MNKIVLLCATGTIILVFFFLIYLIPYFSKKKVKEGRFDLSQFINLFFAPILFIPLLYFIREIVTRNPQNTVIYLPKYFSEITFLLLLYFMILGNGIHAVSVVLSKHMKNLRKHRIWVINEFFHNTFSHLLITASSVFIMFSFTILEINRPNLYFLSNAEIAILIISGIVAGILVGVASIEGSIPNIMFLILYGLSLIIPFLFIMHSLDYRLFPFTTFIEMTLVSSVITLLVYRFKNNGYPEMVPQNFFDE